MQIFTEINSNKNLSLALGFFDGVHKGHELVIKSAVNFAQQNNLKSAVITFKDHPCCFFYGVCPKYILSREDRIKHIEKLGVDYLYLLDFEEISQLSGTEYLENILIKNFNPKSISTGFNHFFGCKKSGDTKLLEDNSKKFGYKYFKLPAQSINNEIISSTLIRKLLAEGKIEEANSMLSAPFAVSGTVIEGNKIGRTIGFKTANMNYPAELVDIPFGVYSVSVYFNDSKLKGIANFGIKPTVAEVVKPILEIHILDFDEDLYGKNLRVEFLKMIRPEKKFNSLAELKTQIEKDILSFS